MRNCTKKHWKSENKQMNRAGKSYKQSRKLKLKYYIHKTFIFSNIRSLHHAKLTIKAWYFSIIYSSYYSTVECLFKKS